MATRYVTRRTTRLYDAAQGIGFVMVLIFGDEVETTGDPVNGRVPALFRGRPGFIDEDHLGDTPALELYFIDVGQGDAAFVVTPGRKKILIDGGYDRRALGFLTWKYRLDRRNPDPVEIDLLVLSHADGDHLDGLLPIVRHPFVHVKRIIHNGLGLFRSGVFPERMGERSADGQFLLTRHDALTELDAATLATVFADWKTAIEHEVHPVEYRAVDATTPLIDIGDPEVTLQVLGPRLTEVDGRRACRWFRDHAHTINGHSVVFRLICGGVSVLFSGDLNTEGARHLLEDPATQAAMDAHVLKTPHHGSHEFEQRFFDAVNPQVSVVSSGDAPDHGHPRASFLGSLGLAQRSSQPLLFSTEIAATFQEVTDPAGTATDLRGLSVMDAQDRAETRIRFKRRLHGMINVRTDGARLYTARRVASGYWWESYEQPLAPRSR